MIVPNFTLLDQDEKTHSLKDYLGKWVIIYFYPRDDTPGCTTEACTLKDNFPKFEKLNAVVLGISADSTKSHKKFAQKYNLPFTLLFDPDKEVIKLFGVWKEKSMYGKKYMGISRETFLINPQGEIQKHYENVKPAEHADEVLRDLEELGKIK